MFFQLFAFLTAVLLQQNIPQSQRKFYLCLYLLKNKPLIIALHFFSNCYYSTLEFTFSLFIFDIIYCSIMRLLKIILGRRKKVWTGIFNAYKIGTRMIIHYYGKKLKPVITIQNTLLNRLHFAMMEVMVYWSFKHLLRYNKLIIFLLTYIC